MRLHILQGSGIKLDGESDEDEAGQIKQDYFIRAFTDRATEACNRVLERVTLQGREGVRTGQGLWHNSCRLVSTVRLGFSSDF